MDWFWTVRTKQKIQKINEEINKLKESFEEENKHINETVSFQQLSKKHKLTGGISSENLNIISKRYTILKQLNEFINGLENILNINIKQIIKEIGNIKMYEKIEKDKDELDYSKIIEEIAIAVVIHLFDILKSRDNIENNFASGEIKK